MGEIILGIDPGTTAAFAAIDKNGNVLKIRSRKHYSMAEMIADIVSVGKAIAVGTDKANVPSFIEKIAHSFGARIIAPSNDLKQADKNALIDTTLPKNLHESDALASAFFAYNEINPLLSKIQNYCSRNNLGDIEDRIIDIVVKQGISISRAVSIIHNKGKVEIADSGAAVSVEKDFGRLLEKIRVLEDDNLKLRIMNEKLDNNKKKKEKIRLVKVLDKDSKKKMSLKEDRIVMFQKMIDILNKEKKQARSEIKRLLEIIKNKDDHVVVKKVNNLTGAEIGKIQGPNIVFAENAHNFDDKGIDTAILKKIEIIAKDYPKKNIGIKVMDADKLGFIDMGDFGIVEKKMLENELSDRNMLKRIIGDYKKERQDI